MARPAEPWRRRYPELVTDDLVAGVLSTRDGWLNPKVFFSVLRAKAAAAGATFLTDRVVDISQDGTVVRAVTLASGQAIPADAVVNAAGVHAPDLAAKVGMPLPVEPMRRHEHYVETSADIAHLPFVKDVHGLAVHAYRAGHLGRPGRLRPPRRRGLHHRRRPTTPTASRRPWPSGSPGWAELTLRDSWTGLYDQNRFDGNMIIGNWPGHARQLLRRLRLLRPRLHARPRRRPRPHRAHRARRLPDPRPVPHGLPARSSTDQPYGEEGVR